MTRIVNIIDQTDPEQSYCYQLAPWTSKDARDFIDMFNERYEKLGMLAVTGEK